MEVLETAIPEIKLLEPVRHIDSPGFFSEVFKESGLRQHGIDIHFVQDNHFLSTSRDRTHPVLSSLPRCFRYEPPDNLHGWNG